MRTRSVTILAAFLLLLAACSPSANKADAGGTADPTTTLTPTTASDSGSGEVMYVLHALVVTVDLSGSPGTLALSGVDQSTVWSTSTTTGVSSTDDFVHSWNDLGFADQPPQAALIYGDPHIRPVVVELHTPAWNNVSRTMLYEVARPEKIEPQFANLLVPAKGQTQRPQGPTAATLLINQTGSSKVPPRPSPTTTTTIPQSQTTTTTTPSTGPTTGSTIPPNTTPGGTTPSPVPTGTPRLQVSKTRLHFATSGGTETFTVTNVGTGVGSWSARISADVGLSVSPRSGVLFPGKSVTVAVTYDPAGGPATDFNATLIFRSGADVTNIAVTVG
jgi:hypothetical protein